MTIQNKTKRKKIKFYRSAISSVCVRQAAVFLWFYVSFVRRIFSFLHCARARTFVSRFFDVIIDSVVILWFRWIQNTQRTKIYIQLCPHLNSRMHDFPMMMMMFTNFCLWKSVALEIQHKIDRCDAIESGTILGSYFIVFLFFLFLLLLLLLPSRFCTFCTHLNEHSNLQGKPLLFVNKNTTFWFD